MAEAARAGATRLHRGIPDEIAIWEILVRVPPKALLRCRAVCRAWRHATSTVDFLLAHHGRQPCLPLLYGYGSGLEYGPYGGCNDCLDIISFDHRAAAAAQLRDVATLDEASYDLKASCDGLLILSTAGSSYPPSALYYSVCNPATRQYARLPLIRGFMLLGMYPHSGTGEYRLLLSTDPDLIFKGPGVEDGCYVFALGSDQPPRQIGLPEPEGVELYGKPVLIDGGLHWEIEGKMIMVFNTTAESFREMHAPVASGLIDLFEMDGMLGISSFNDAGKSIDIWVLRDYKSEVWTFKCRIELPVTEIRMQCDIVHDRWTVMVVPGDGELLVLVQFGKWLLQVGMDSKLVASFDRGRICFSQLRLKQTLVPHTFFPTLEGYVVNDLPFISKVVE